MATKKKLIEIDEKALEILEEQAKLQKRSLKNYLEYFIEEKALYLSEPSDEYKKIMDEGLDAIEKGTAKTISMEEIRQQYGVPSKATLRLGIKKMNF
jgi:hypothetical protein